MDIPQYDEILLLWKNNVIENFDPHFAVFHTISMLIIGFNFIPNMVFMMPVIQRIVGEKNLVGRTIRLVGVMDA